jgi:hypothetical protein
MHAGGDSGGLLLLMVLVAVLLIRFWRVVLAVVATCVVSLILVGLLEVAAQLERLR